MNLVVLGDALLDRDVHGTARRLSPDAPVPVLDQEDVVARAGGAGLAASLAAADGHDVTLVTGLAPDDGGRELARRLAGAGVEVVDLGLAGTTPEKIRFFAGTQPLLRLDRGAGVAVEGDLTAAARARLGWADGILVSDYGRGLSAHPGVRAALAEQAGRLPIVWDPHPRGARPVAGVTAATPNQAEAQAFAPVAGGDASKHAQALRETWAAGSVCVTCGARGAVLACRDRAPVALPAPPVVSGDPCGAGDRFASRLTAALAAGASLVQAGAEAVAASSAFVAAGGARRALRPVEAPPDAEARDAVALAEQVRAAGGTVVATGGCFDLLHAGHVSTLQAARALGDCLIVCLNSDASVRRLKGDGRPLVPQHDRASVLDALACVDGVAIFDEDTPTEILRAVAPHVWVKGGDYAGVRLPEADVLAEWGGRAYVLPYLDGHSTTRLIEEAAANV